MQAKNLVSSQGLPTKTALAVVAIQQALPESRVLYCSATGASEPKNLAYMTRLGLFGFKDFATLLKSLQQSDKSQNGKKCMGALEMYAMGLKSTGAYMCRTLSYEGAEFQLEQAPLSEEMKKMYDRACEFWQVFTDTHTTPPGTLCLSVSSWVGRDDGGLADARWFWVGGERAAPVRDLPNGGCPVQGREGNHVAVLGRAPALLPPDAAQRQGPSSRADGERRRSERKHERGDRPSVYRRGGHQQGERVFLHPYPCALVSHTSWLLQLLPDELNFEVSAPSQAIAEGDGMGMDEFVSAPSMIVTELIKNHLHLRGQQQQGTAAYLAPLYRNLVKACKAWVTMPRVATDIEQAALTSVAVSRRQGDETGTAADFTPAFIAASEAAAARAHRVYGYGGTPRAVAAAVATPAAATATVPAADDGDVVMTKEVSFEEAMLLRREAAERNGCMVDLTEDLPEEEKTALLEQSDKEVRRLLASPPALTAPGNAPSVRCRGAGVDASALSGCCVQAAALKAQTAALLAKAKEVAAAVDRDAAMAVANDDSGESSFLHPHRSVHPTSLGKEISLVVLPLTPASLLRDALLWQMGISSWRMSRPASASAWCRPWRRPPRR